MEKYTAQGIVIWTFIIACIAGTGYFLEHLLELDEGWVKIGMVASGIGAFVVAIKSGISD